MGASVNEEKILTQDMNSIFSRDRRTEKTFYDNVHGSIYLEPLFLQFVDTKQFQRLRDLKQLGLAHMVYPGAVHSRFEHSLGVYWLAGEAVQKLKTNQAELDINRFDIQTVRLAGLLHDIGHGPFSHVFERGFLPLVVPNGTQWSHEDMSAKLVDYMVDENHIDINDDLLKRAKSLHAASSEIIECYSNDLVIRIRNSFPLEEKELILASSEIPLPETQSTGKKHFLYDIVANGRNGIDVDKFDYIVRDCRACGLGCNFQFQRLMDTMRVVGDEICYRAKEYLTVYKLFATRADLHRTVYTHAKVKAIELMVVDALIKADSHLHISSRIHDTSEYWKLDDTILKHIETHDHPNLKESKDLIHRIRRRDLYQFCNEYAVPKDKLEHFKEITAQDIVCSQKSSGITLNEEDVAVCNVKIDLSRGRSNPLESVKFFQAYESEDTLYIPDDRVSHLLPTCYQDIIVRVYSKKPELVGEISEAFNNFQMKMYGSKPQVHETPEKKKRRVLLENC